MYNHVPIDLQIVYVLGSGQTMDSYILGSCACFNLTHYLRSMSLHKFEHDTL